MGGKNLFLPFFFIFIILLCFIYYIIFIFLCCDSLSLSKHQETLLFHLFDSRCVIARCLFLHPFSSSLPSLALSLQKCDCLLSLEAYSADQKRRVCQCLKDNIDKQLQLHRREPPVPHFEQV